MRSAREGDERRCRAVLDDVTPSRGEDEIVRGPDRGVHGVQKPAAYLEGTLAGRHESLGPRREKESPAVEVSEGTARGVGDDAQAQRFEEGTPRQEADGEDGVREVEQRGDAEAREA